MAAAARPRPGCSWIPSPRPRDPSAPPSDRSTVTSRPWVDDEQVRLARDLGALLQAGLIVPIDGGDDHCGDVRFAITETAPEDSR